MRIPKYQMIKNDLKQQLASGKFESGDKFYTEAELMNIFQVSSITVIRALNDLVTEGYLMRRQGKGTFVTQVKVGKNIRFSNLERFPAHADEVTVLAMTRGKDKTILSRLSLEKKEAYYCIERVRRTNSKPYLYQKSYIPERFIKKGVTDLAYYHSIYQRFEEDFDIHMQHEDFTEIHEIKMSTPQEVATMLDISPEEATVLQVRTTYNEANGQVFEYVEAYKKLDFYKIKLTSE